MFGPTDISYKLRQPVLLLVPLTLCLFYDISEKEEAGLFDDAQVLDRAIPES